MHNQIRDVDTTQNQVLYRFTLVYACYVDMFTLGGESSCY